MMCRGHALCLAQRPFSRHSSGALFSDLNVFENVAFPLRVHTDLPEAMVRDMTRDWDIRPEIATGEQARRAMFARADAALAASGTVTLELALAGIPLVSCYQTDMIARLLRRLITAWSASLPNLIAGYPVVPELYEFMLRPNYTARHLSALLSETPSRSAQVAGFEAIRDLMARFQQRLLEERARGVRIGCSGVTDGQYCRF